MTDHEALEALAATCRMKHRAEAANTPFGVMPSGEFDKIATTLTTIAQKLRTGQLIPAPSVDDAMVERCAIFRQIGRWEMAQEIAFNLETPAKDCTPGAPEQAAFDKAAKLVSMSVSALAGREFCKLPVHVQFHDGEWAPIMDAAAAAISAMQVKP